MSDTLRSTTVRNIGYTSIARIIQLLTSAIANIVLTRTLLPSDYGIVGFAGIFISFFAQFGDVGIGYAVIQKKELNDRELYTAFTIKAFLSLVIFLVAFFCAPFTVIFFDNPAVVSVMRLLAFNFVLGTFSFLPNLLLTRDLDYKKISYASVLSSILSSVVAVVLALAGFKYWSLVIASIFMTITTCIFVNVFRPVRYRFANDYDAAKHFIMFGGNVFLAGFTTVVTFNADNFLIGAIKGATNLGYYSVAFQWGSMACAVIGSVVLSVLFPTFSKIQGEKERLRSSYLKILQYVSFGGVLVNMTLFVVSKDFLVLVLGHNTDKWIPALATLRILCFYGIARLLLEPVGNVVIALGRMDILRKATLLVAAVELSFLYPVLYAFSIEGVAMLVTVAYLTQYGLYYRCLRRELGIDIKELHTCVHPALFGIIPLGIIFAVGEAGFGISVLNLILKLIGCIGVYLVTYGLSNKWMLYRDLRIQLVHLILR